MTQPLTPEQLRAAAGQDPNVVVGHIMHLYDALGIDMWAVFVRVLERQGTSIDADDFIQPIWALTNAEEVGDRIMCSAMAFYMTIDQGDIDLGRVARSDVLLELVESWVTWYYG